MGEARGNKRYFVLSMVYKMTSVQILKKVRSEEQS